MIFFLSLIMSVFSAIVIIINQPDSFEMALLVCFSFSITITTVSLLEKIHKKD